jgi:drug/metabolite transporter (DMT)-like permease
MLIGLVGVAMFSLTLPITKIALEALNPYFISFGRATLAGLAALIYVISIKAPIPELQTLKKLGIIVLGVIVGFPLLLTLALDQGSSSHGAIMIGILPLVTSIVGAIRFKERPSIGFWIAAIVGAGLVLTYALITGSGQLSQMDILLVLACIFSAIGYAEGAELSRRINPKLVISWALIVSLPLNGLITVLNFEESFLRAEAQVWIAFVYLGLFSMYIGFFFWYAGLAKGGIARVSQVQLVQPFLTLASICSSPGVRL